MKKRVLVSKRHRSQGVACLASSREAHVCFHGVGGAVNIVLRAAQNTELFHTQSSQMPRGLDLMALRQTALSNTVHHVSFPVRGFIFSSLDRRTDRSISQDVLCKPHVTKISVADHLWTDRQNWSLSK